MQFATSNGFGNSVEVGVIWGHFLKCPTFFVERHDGQSIAIVTLMNHWPLTPLRLEDNLDAAVFLVAECLVHTRTVFQWNRVGDHERWIDLTLLDSMQ